MQNVLAYMVSFSELLSLCGVFIAFVLVIFLIRRKWNFGLSLMIGSLIIGLFSLLIISPTDILKAVIKASFYSFDTGEIITETAELAILMTLIFLLAKLMEKTGAIKQLIHSLGTFFSHGGILAVIPAVYGLMPVPGGALFSAPLIDKEGEKYKISKDQKNMLNIWFRHIWFPIYPISSAMILIVSLEFSNISIYSLILANLISFLSMIVIGLFFLKHYIRSNTSKKTKVDKDFKGLIYLFPPILPLLFYIVLHSIDFPQIRSFLLGVLASILLLFFITKTPYETYISYIKGSLTISLALAIFGIMIFRNLFEVSQVNVLIAETISDLAFPAILIVLFVPMLLGLLTGYNLGAIALSYFLVQPFFGLTGISIVGVTSIIFMASFIGYLISPIHLCNVLSSDYLKTDATRMYPQFIPAAIIILIIQLIYVFLFYQI